MSDNCLEICANATGCSGLTSSNGHSTWCTPLYNDSNWDEVCNYDMEGISAPYIMESGQPACNGFKPNESFRMKNYEKQTEKLLGVSGKDFADYCEYIELQEMI